jgi:Histidine kinase-, DNA gyrase B-, and HSP90-like ATPase
MLVCHVSITPIRGYKPSQSMIDYSQFETTPAVPEASSMIETFRAIGYGIEGAIADIVDNSISAGAKNIWINFEWKGAATWLSIKDDGIGMSNDELIQAMRPGSKHPLDRPRLKAAARKCTQFPKYIVFTATT